MRSITIHLPPNPSEDLQNSPHVIHQMIDMLFGEEASSPEQQEQRLAHLGTCVPCQTFLEAYLFKTIEYEKAHGNPAGRAQELLTQLQHTIHQALQVDMPAYVDALQEQGIEEARGKFSQFAEHLQTCQECQEAVRDVQAWTHL